MSSKRRANTELNRDNWDQEDEPQEMGTFRKADEGELKKRVIKTARRRVTTAGASDSEQNSFSPFSNINITTNGNTKTPPAFSFLSSTNSDKKPAFSFSANANVSTESAAVSITSAASSTVSTASDVPAKPSFAFNLTSSTVTNNPTSSATTNNASSGASSLSEKAKSSSSVPKKSAENKIGSNSSSNITAQNKEKLTKLDNDLKKTRDDHNESKKKNETDEIFTQKLKSLNLLCAEWMIKHLNENLCYILTPIFDDYNKHLTQLREERKRAKSSSKLLKLATSDNKETSSSALKDTKASVSKSEPKLGLTSSSSSFMVGSKTKDSNTSITKLPPPTINFQPVSMVKPNFNFSNAPANDGASPSTNKKLFGGVNKSDDKTEVPEKPSTKPSMVFSFSSSSPKPSSSSSSSSTTTETKTNFNFGPASSNQPTSSLFSLAQSTANVKESTLSKLGGGGIAKDKDAPSSSTTETKTSDTFKFGPASSSQATSSFFPLAQSTMSSGSSKPDDGTAEDEDAPPVVVDETITEEGSVYDKKCKLYFKKDDNFVDHGVGFLFLKLIGDEKKCQIIVRANNKLATIIMNTMLPPSVPIQAVKNNVIFACCPTPEVQQPITILIKVKTPQDAEELSANLKKYQK